MIKYFNLFYYVLIILFNPQITSCIETLLLYYSILNIGYYGLKNGMGQEKLYRLKSLSLHSMLYHVQNNSPIFLPQDKLHDQDYVLHVL